MGRRIYRILIVISIALGVYLFIASDTQSKGLLITLSSLFFLLFSTGIHGLLAHSLKPSAKSNIIVYSLVMGLLWVVMFGIFVFFLLPLFCPNFVIEF